MNKPKVQNSLIIHAWGGVGGQLLTLCYALWIAKNRLRPVHIKFHDGGTSFRPIAVRELLETDTVKKLGITYSQIHDYQSSSSRKKIVSNFLKKYFDTFVHLIQQKTQNPKTILSSPDITFEMLLSLSNTIEELSGSTNDYRVVEETIPLLRKALKESPLPDFFESAGNSHSLALHWRLGDYIGNEFHGAIDFVNLHKVAETLGLGSEVPRIIYTDSPDYAESELLRLNLWSMYSISSLDIWTDLYNMSRSKYFVGNHSSISMFSAIAIHFAQSNSQIFFPEQWFVSENDAHRFHPPISYEKFHKYSSTLI